MADFLIRSAAPGDEALICALLGELAAFENLSGHFFLDEECVRRDLLGAHKAAYCELAFHTGGPEGHAGEPAGLAVWFWTYRSFRARRGLFVEDLYVRPQFRGQSLGTRLLAHLARTARAEDGWMEWLVLDWNAPARTFYGKLGARPVEEWLGYKLDGEALAALADT